jgi:hypothetical protein
MASTLSFLGRYSKDCDEFLSHIVGVTGDETRVSFVNVETNEQSKQWMHTHSPKKPKKFKQISICEKVGGDCFLGQERSADGGVHATRDHNNARSVLRNTKKLLRAFPNKRYGMLTYGVVLPHDNTLPHTSACTRALLEHFNWELFDHPPYSPDYAPSDCYLFTYLKNWLG